jgi:hypothetical protein
MQKTANLARIRDNQRRSRARRKDYLKELETRYRNCEQIGVSASTELQAAAKGVAEENRRLRDLLRAYGISEVEIDGASGSQGSAAADMLEAMIAYRQPCGPGDGCAPVTDPSRQLQPAPVPPQASTQLPRLPTTYQESIPAVTSAASTPQYMNQMTSPAVLQSREQSADTMYSPIGLEPSQYPLMHGYDMSASDQMAFMNPYGHGHPQNVPTPQNAPRNNSYQDGRSSCQVAADTIRTFSPNAGRELEQELGCRAPGDECSVSNLKIFNVIDRYTVGAD